MRGGGDNKGREWEKGGKEVRGRKKRGREENEGKGKGKGWEWGGRDGKRTEGKG